MSNKIWYFSKIWYFVKKFGILVSKFGIFLFLVFSGFGIFRVSQIYTLFHKCYSTRYNKLALQGIYIYNCDIITVLFVFHLSVCWVLQICVSTFMHLPPPVLFVCLSAKPWRQRDFAPSTNPTK